MKISNVIVATLVLASLNSVAQNTPKQESKPKPKISEKTPDKKIAKKDSSKTAEPKREKWNCPPCGMG